MRKANRLRWRRLRGLSKSLKAPKDDGQKNKIKRAQTGFSKGVPAPEDGEDDEIEVINS